MCALWLSLQLASVNGRHSDTGDIFKHTHSRQRPVRGGTGWERAKEAKLNHVMSGADEDVMGRAEQSDINISEGEDGDEFTGNSWSLDEGKGKRLTARAEERGGGMRVSTRHYDVSSTDGTARSHVQVRDTRKKMVITFRKCILLLFTCFTTTIVIDFEPLSFPFLILG